MARYTFQPSRDRASTSFALADGRRIRSGMVFEVTAADLAIIKAVNERVPGPTPPGSKERLLAIRPVEAQPGPSGAASSQAIDGDLYAQLAERVGLDPTVSPVGLLEEIGARLSGLERLEAQLAANAVKIEELEAKLETKAKAKRKAEKPEEPAPEAPVEGEG